MRAVTLALVAAVLVPLLGAAPAHADGTTGSFEVDGDRPDVPAGEPIDWDTPPPNLTTIPDLTKSNDDSSFETGSKTNQPGFGTIVSEATASWDCGYGGVPPKSDYGQVQVAFRTVGSEQFLYANFERLTANGDVHLDLYFALLSEPHPGCADIPGLEDPTDAPPPIVSNGDVVFSFDSANAGGGKVIVPSVATWQFTDADDQPTDVNTGQGFLDPATTLVEGIHYDTALSDNELFGEISINLTTTIGGVECGEFASLYARSRASASEDATLKDRSRAVTPDLGLCPNVTEPTKLVRNVTQGTSFALTQDANPGDELEYEITVTNDGEATATGVTVTDVIERSADGFQAFLSCSDSCSTGTNPDGDTVLTWGPFELPVGSTTLTFRTVLAEVFPEGQTVIDNAAVVDDDFGGPQSSPPTEVTVTASPDIGVDKRTEGNVTTVNVGDTLTYLIDVENAGNADAVVDVIDDYDQDHVTVSNISLHGSSQINDGDMITWAEVPVAANTTATLSYDATFVGTFTGGDGTQGCDPGTFPVVNTVTVAGESDDQTVCVDADPELAITKDADDDEDGDETFTLGDSTTYRVTVSNTGAAPAQGITVEDDFDEDHVAVSDISDGGSVVDDGGNLIIRWTGVNVPAEDSVQLTYTATFIGTFSQNSDPQTCDGPDEFAVVNAATVVGGPSTSETVCVIAAPDFVVTKTATDTTVAVDGTTTFTIAVENVGSADGMVDVVDDYDQDHVSVSDISDGGVSNDDTITWSGVLVPAGETATLTYLATFNGPFSGPSGGGECEPGQFPVVNTVTVTGEDPVDETVCVIAAPDFVVTKTATDTTVAVGDSTTYTITVENLGSADGVVDVVDDYDESHVSVSDISDNGTDTGTTIEWTGVLVPAGETATFTYLATFNGPFSGPSGGGECEPGQFPVVNTVTVTGEDPVDETVCVIADPDLAIAKALADPGQTSAGAGDEITFVINFSNAADAATAEGTVISDTLPQHTAFVSCTGPTGAEGDCDTSGDPTITWDIGPVDPGASGSVTLTVVVLPSVDCDICNSATIAATNADVVASEEICLTGIPAANPGGANTSGSAFGADVEAVGIDLRFTEVSSQQSGIGSNADNDELDTILGLIDPDLLDAELFATSSTSTITDEPGSRARTVATATTTGLNILNGVVTADAVRAVATAEADGDSSSFTSNGSTIVNGEVDTNGSLPGGVVALDDLPPNSRIDLNEIVFGLDSYVAVYEVNGSTSQPPDGQTSGGTYAADVVVNMIHVHVTGLAGLAPLDIRVSQAEAHADFPQTTVCEAAAGQAVSGHAFILSEQTDPSLLPVRHGYVEISPQGGDETQSLNRLRFNTINTTADAATSHSEGALSPTDSTASSYAEVTNLCLLRSQGTCLVSGEMVRAQANASADATGASSDAAGTTFIGSLTVAGETVTMPVAPNTVIELPGGMGFMILNEQSPEAVAGPAHATAFTTRAMRIVVTTAGLGLPVGAEIIVAEAHADARFTP